MRKQTAVFCILFTLLLTACGRREETRSDYAERKDKPTFFETGADGAVLSDPMKRNIPAWYRKTYLIWKSDHARLLRELKDRSQKGVRIWHANVKKDLNAMRKMIADEKLAERMDEIINTYESIKNKGLARQGTSGTLYRMKKLGKEIRNDFKPSTIELKHRELTDEKDPPQKKDKKKKDGPTKVKPKW